MSGVAYVEDGAVVFVERTFESSKPAAVKSEVSLNFFTAQDCLGDSDADAFLEHIEIFFCRQTENSFCELVVARNDFFQCDILLKLFYFEGIENVFEKFFHKNHL